MRNDETIKVKGTDRSQEALGSMLAQWAIDARVDKDPLLARLSAALQAGTGLTTWAGLDFFNVLPEPALVKTQRFDRLVRLLRLLRNAMVFLPVLVTWWDLRSAVAKYADFVQGSPLGDSASFLVFWAENGLTGTAVKIVVIVGFAIALGLMVDLAERESTSGSGEINARRRDLAVRLTEALRPRQKVDMSNVEESLTGALEGFRDTAQMLRTSTERMRDVLESTEGLRPQLQELKAEMGAISREISGGMTAGVAKLNEELVVLTSNIQRIENVLSSQVDGRIDNVASALSATSELLGQSARTIETAIHRVYKGAADIHPDLQQFRAELTALRREADYPFRPMAPRSNQVVANSPAEPDSLLTIQDEQ
jgi:hypothetical protein